MRKTKIALIGGASLVGLAAAGLGVRHLVTRDRPSKKILRAMGIPPTLTAVGIVHPVLGITEAKYVSPLRKKKLPARMPKAPPPGLKVWGTTTDEPNVYWSPGYLKSDGCKDFRWGLCYDDLIDSIMSDPDVPQWTRDLKTIIPVIAKVFSADAARIADWIEKNVCVRFKWPLYGYYWLGGGSRWLAVSRHDADRRLIAATPLHPFPTKSGYKRVWFSKEGPAMTRSDRAIQVYWPDRETPKLAELLQVVEIRAMLRLDYRASGSINAKKLAEAACGKSKWWLARRSKAMEEFV